MPADAETQKNNLVLTALFKQMDIGAHGAIDFNRLAGDIGVNGQNAARHPFNRFKKCSTRTDGLPPTVADVNNNILVMGALFKQIETGRIDFTRLAKDMGVNGQNSARYRWKRLLKSFGISKPSRARGEEGRNDRGDGGEDDEKKLGTNPGNKDGKEDRNESDEAVTNPVKVEANTKISRRNQPGSPLKFEITREGSGLDSLKKDGKRKMEEMDGDLTGEKQGARLMQIPARKLPKKGTMKSIQKMKRGKQGNDDDTDGGDEGFESGFEDIDYTKAAEKKKRRLAVDEYGGGGLGSLGTL
ncbi:hypothetical protein BOTCAL_0139g00160 [Botryotinia calthae]|uniref:Myb-like DNA-binding domain-containing protein n=1 Tax=Botryotinia calthae TaxID=38488 RepID=A0A4Y8D377_9HELO|nr:hypothetical protein BOTCAL_0139g00160 [Botryotinia calthae]